MSLYQHQTPVGHHDVVTTSRWSAFSAGQVLGGIVGIVAIVFGALAIARGGIDSDLNTPLVQVAGFTQSALVGIIELAFGLLLLAGAASPWNRGLLGVIGALMFAGGLIVGSASNKILTDLGTDHATGWLVMIGGIAAMIAAILPMVMHHESRTDAV
jgi:hypothetical protein